MKLKILILSDSNANPRSTPLSDMTMLEETYPYLLRNEFKDSLFYQLSFGNITTEELLNQAISYLSHLKFDIIVVQSGIVDCRPEAFTEFQKSLINAVSGPFARFLKKHIYNPKLIKWRQIFRVSKRRFRKALKKFKLIFNSAKIYWVEISVSQDYENERPGVHARIHDYNEIIKEIYSDDIIKINKDMLDLDGHNADNLHMNKKGHQLTGNILADKINLFLKAAEEKI